MSEYVVGALSIVGLVVSLLLLRYILKTLKKMKALNEQEQVLTRKIQNAHEDMRLNASQSIKVLAQCMLDEQVELAEGCIRIKVLLDHVAPEFHQDPYFKIFSHVYDATRHMPTHAARKEVDKKTIMKFDLERMKLEAKHKDEIIAASRQLLSRLT